MLFNDNIHVTGTPAVEHKYLQMEIHHRVHHGLTGSSMTSVL